MLCPWGCHCAGSLVPGYRTPTTGNYDGCLVLWCGARGGYLFNSVMPGGPWRNCNPTPLCPLHGHRATRIVEPWSKKPQIWGSVDHGLRFGAEGTGVQSSDTALPNPYWVLKSPVVSVRHLEAY